MDDQAETVLQKLITRTPPETLSGILPVTPTHIARPLLDQRRKDVHEWIDARSIEYRTDSSNADLRFLRNRVRLKLLPVLEKIRSARRRKARRNRRTRPGDPDSTRTGQEDGVGTVGPRSERSAIAISALPEDPSLRRMIMLDEIQSISPEGREVSSQRLETLPEELSATGRISLGDGLDASLENGAIVLEHQQERPAIADSRTIRAGQTICCEEIGASVTLRRIDSPDRLTGDSRHVQVFGLPVSAEDSVFVVRGRRPGDRFQPLGMTAPEEAQGFSDRPESSESRERCAPPSRIR